MEVEEIISEVLNKNGVKYCFIGKGAAILQGYPGTTIDVDIFPQKSLDNCKRLIESLSELKFELDEETNQAILEGKDFIQLSNPYPLDIVFAPDGIENFEDAEIVNLEGLPVLSLKDIIKSKESSGREKDKQDLEYLKLFKKHKDSNS